jgi:DNA-binding transcriptional ArsR family regulator
MTYHAFQALADPTRREIFERLSRAPMAVGALAAELPVSRPAVSQHLRVLKKAQLVVDRRVGTRRIYSVDLDGLSEVHRYLDRLWDDVLRSFQAEAEAQAKRNQEESKDE